MSSPTNIEIRQIILPFDFSNASMNALQHSIVLARKFRADLTLLTVMDTYTSHAVEYRGNKFVEFEQLAAEKLTGLCKQIFTFNKIDFSIKDLKWNKCVSQAAEEKASAFIVLGVGGKGRDTYFDSANAHKIVDALHIPVLAVKESNKANDYKVITAPLDETFHTREKIPYVTLLAGAFDAKVSLVGLQSHQDKESVSHMHAIMKQASYYIQQKVRAYQDKLITSKNAVTDILKTAEEDKADMVVIMSQHEKSLSGIFSGPYAQQVTNQSNHPVLICPPRVSLVMGAVSI